MSRRQIQSALFEYALICSALRGSLPNATTQRLSSEDLIGSLVELFFPTLISDMDTVVAELMKGICSMAIAKPVPGLTDGVTFNLCSRGARGVRTFTCAGVASEVPQIRVEVSKINPLCWLS